MGMTTKRKNTKPMSNLEMIKPKTGVELTPEEIEILKKRGIYEDLEEAPRIAFSEESHKESKAKLSYIFKKEWKNLNDNKVHVRKSCCICVSCLYQIYKLTHKNSRIRKVNFMFGWILFRILTREYRFEDEKTEENSLHSWIYLLSGDNHKKISEINLRFNWREAHRWMYVLTKDYKFYYEGLSPRKRHQNYRTGKDYVRIVVDAHLNRIVLAYEVRARALAKIRIERFRKFWSLTTRILTYLEQERQAGRTVVRRHEIVKRLSNERFPAISNCLGYLVHIEEILWGSKEKDVRYIGKDKTGIDISRFVFNALLGL